MKLTVPIRLTSTKKENFYLNGSKRDLPLFRYMISDNTRSRYPKVRRDL
jgi:hypothetical protein